MKKEEEEGNEEEKRGREVNEGEEERKEMSFPNLLRQRNRKKERNRNPVQIVCLQVYVDLYQCLMFPMFFGLLF